MRTVNVRGTGARRVDMRCIAARRVWVERVSEELNDNGGCERN